MRELGVPHLQSPGSSLVTGGMARLRSPSNSSSSDVQGPESAILLTRWGAISHRLVGSMSRGFPCQSKR
jgi:hypothetical protein